MFSSESIERARARAQRVTGVKLPFAVEVSAGEGLCVTLAGGAARIEAQD